MLILKTGIRCVKEETVTEDLTAFSIGSGGLRVYATPAMIRLMENAAWSSVEDCMEEGCSTVGTLMEIKHVSASPVGAHIRCESELTGIDGRKLTFKVAAYDDTGLIGEGMHERYIIQTGKFMSKADSKLNGGADNEKK